MNPVSFAVGIIGLAGLFSTCLEVVEKFDSKKEFGIESRSIRAQFKAQRLRLQQWGQDVGLQGDTLMEKHSKQLDDPRTYSIVEELLSAIRGICTYEDDLALTPGSPIEHPLKTSSLRYQQGKESKVLANGTWFLDWSSSDFSGGAKVLWINGPAGFGKSILCAKIVEHMTLISKAPVAHFFFSSDFESRRDPFIAMRSWISQMMSNKTAFGLIRQKASENQGQKSTRVDIVQLLREIVAAIPHCTFIVDGLDEYSWVGDRQKIDDGGSVFDFLETLRNAVEGTQARILIVSRDEPEIRNCLSGNEKALVIYRHRITPDDVRSDTETYSRSIVNKKLSNCTETTKEDIAMKLSNRCYGQFLWVKMQEDCLRSGKSQKKIEQAINSTPTGLEHTYKSNWQKISQLPDEDRDRTISLLRWTQCVGFGAKCVDPFHVWETKEPGPEPEEAKDD
ncbi:hypothetical protein N7490_002695 [Penicillium lividum]|nr:hypothetical protein N7490_002695 [Penicillium lividum]